MLTLLQEVVFNLSRKEYWIGANERGHEGLYVNLDGTIFAGDPPLYGNLSELNDCLFVAQESRKLDKFIAVTDCHDKKKGFVCERLSSMRDGDINCGADWRLYESTKVYLCKVLPP